jgi:hypothetical protein
LDRSNTLQRCGIASGDELPDSEVVAESERVHFRDSTSLFKSADPKVRCALEMLAACQRDTTKGLTLADGLTQRMLTSLVRLAPRCACAQEPAAERLKSPT